jgi:hypothetical protein
MVSSVAIELVIEVLDVFERHGLRYSDDLHSGRAVDLVRAAAMAYDGLVSSPREGAAGTALVLSELKVLADMCEDARTCATAGIEVCADCDKFPENICLPHAEGVARAHKYRELARRLGATVTS